MGARLPWRPGKRELEGKKNYFSRELDTKNAGMPAFSYHIGKPG
jgi:hypothetical protein